MGKFVDLSGLTFGMLIVLRRAAMPAGLRRRKMAFWEVQCSCGSAAFTTRSDALRAGRTTSCGCKRSLSNTTHGQSRTPLYKVWLQMVQRCHNPDDAWFHAYGARGIAVCDRWRSSFALFREDVGERPRGATVERIDNARGYEPDNVRWATRTEQMNNTRTNRWLERDGHRMTIAQWSRETGIPKSTIWSRMRRGLAVPEILSAPRGRT